MNEAKLAAMAGAGGALWTYPAVFLVLVLAGIGLPIPEELTFLTAGIITQQTGGHVWIMALVAIAGVLVGDVLCFMAGRHWGRDLLARRPFNRVVKPRHVARAEGFFEQHGRKAVFFGSLVAGLRAPTFFMAGTMRVSFSYFLLVDGLRAVITGGGTVWLAYHLGSAAEEWLGEHKGKALAALAVVALIVGIWEWRRAKRADAAEQVAAAEKAAAALGAATAEVAQVDVDLEAADREANRHGA